MITDFNNKPADQRKVLAEVILDEATDRAVHLVCSEHGDNTEGIDAEWTPSGE